MWTAHGIATGKLPIDVAAIFDVLIAAFLGFGLALAVAILCRRNPVHQWLIFAGAFLVSLAVPTFLDREYVALLWFLSQPFIAVFLLFAALGFWLPSRRSISRHVA